MMATFCGRATNRQNESLDILLHRALLAGWLAAAVGCQQM